MHCSPSQLSGTLYQWLLLTAEILKLCVCWGCFSPACPDDWVRQMKPILFAVGVLFSCQLSACSVFSGSVLFLFCRHLETGNFAPSGTVPIPCSQFAHQCVCTNCLCECIYMCMWLASHFKNGRVKTV